MLLVSGAAVGDTPPKRRSSGPSHFICVKSRSHVRSRPSLRPRLLRMLGNAVRMSAMTSEPFHRGDPYDLGASNLEVLRLLASGPTDEEIAEQLKVSIHTVQSGVMTVLRKTMSASRTEAAIKAIKGGLAVAFFMLCSSTVVTPIERHHDLSNQATGCERRHVVVGEKRVRSPAAILTPITSDSKDCGTGHRAFQHLADRRTIRTH